MKENEPVLPRESFVLMYVKLAKSRLPLEKVLNNNNKHIFLLFFFTQ